MLDFLNDSMAHVQLQGDLLGCFGVQVAKVRHFFIFLTIIAVERAGIDPLYSTVTVVVYLKLRILFSWPLRLLP